MLDRTEELTDNRKKCEGNAKKPERYIPLFTDDQILKVSDER